MSKKIAGGLGENQWGQVWLQLHEDSRLSNALNAVGIDQNGYLYLEKRSAWKRGIGDPKTFVDDYEIKRAKLP